MREEKRKPSKKGLLLLLMLLACTAVIGISFLLSQRLKGLYDGLIQSNVTDNRPLDAACILELLSVDANQDGIPDYQQYTEISGITKYDNLVLRALGWVSENINDIDENGNYGTPSAPYPPYAPPEKPLLPNIPMPPYHWPEAGPEIGKPKEPAIPALPESKPESASGSCESSSDDTIWVPGHPSRPQAPHITGIAVTALPDKTAYIEEECFDPAGLVVEIRLSNGTSSPATAIKYPTKPLAMGTESVDISVQAGGTLYTAPVKITVREKVLQAVEVTPLPGKEYIEGQTPHKDDFLATGRYDNGKTYPLPDISVPSLPLERGQTEITVTVKDREEIKTAAVPIKVRDKAIDTLTVSAPPDKTAYIEGERFDSEGLAVTVQYNNGVEEKEVTPTIPDTALMLGQESVAVSYTEESRTVMASIPVTVEAKQITSIEVTRLPDKTEYIEFEPFDPAGLEYAIHYDNGDTETVTDANLPPLELRSGDNEAGFTITRGGSSGKLIIPVTVRLATPLALTITSGPDKTDYIEEEAFDPEGMAVTVRYDNGKEIAVSGVEITPEVLSIGDIHTQILYAYNNTTVTTDIAVSVRLKTPVSLHVDTAPTKTEYRNEEDFDLSGLSGSALYDNGKTYPVQGITTRKLYPVMGNTAAELGYTENGRTVTASIPITVTREQLTAVSIGTMPDKTTYVEETGFEPDGLTILCEYDNGKSKTVSEVEFDSAPFKLGNTEKTVAVTHYGKTLTLNIPVTVTRAKPVFLRLTSYHWI